MWSAVQIRPPQPSELVEGPYYEMVAFLFRAGSKLLLPSSAVFASPYCGVIRISSKCFLISVLARVVSPDISSCKVR